MRNAKLLESEEYRYRVQLPGSPEDATRAVFEAAKASGAQVRGIKLAERSLEEAFLAAIGSPAAHGVAPPPPLV